MLWGGKVVTRLKERGSLTYPRLALGFLFSWFHGMMFICEVGMISTLAVSFTPVAFSTVFVDGSVDGLFFGFVLFGCNGSPTRFLLFTITPLVICSFLISIWWIRKLSRQLGKLFFSHCNEAWMVLSWSPLDVFVGGFSSDWIRSW